MSSRLSMKALFVAGIILLAHAAVACWQTEYPKATIYGGTVSLLVQSHGKPLKFAKVIFYADGKIVRQGRTTSEGVFEATDIPVGQYRMHIPKWGSADITVLQPVLGKHVVLTFDSLDDGCLSVETRK